MLCESFSRPFRFHSYFFVLINVMFVLYTNLTLFIIHSENLIFMQRF